jgi:hypothetical protein
MDVHPPHGPLHHWKDFWIHLGTITVGLLIALALEAGAEELHHLHQRHQLEEDLRNEGLRNREIMENDFVYLDNVVSYVLAENHRVLEMEAGVATPDVAPVSGRLYMNPAQAAWVTAVAGGALDLLPPEEARVYARLYRISDVSYEAAVTSNKTLVDVEAYDAKFADGVGYPPKPDLTRMSKAELDELSTLLLKDAMTLRYQKLRVKYLYGSNEAVLRGETSERDQVTAAHEAAVNVKDHIVDPGPVVGKKQGSGIRD